MHRRDLCHRSRGTWLGMLGLACWLLVAGAAWTAEVIPLRAGARTTSQLQIAVDGSSPGRVYFVEAEEPGPGRLYRSDDGGTQVVDITPAGEWLPTNAALAVLPDGTVLVSIGTGGALRSEDQGASWSLRPFDGCCYRILPSPTRPGTVFATGYGHLNFSTDWGLSWSPLPGPDSEDLAVFEIAVAASEPETIYVAHVYDGIYRTADDGQNWTLLPAPWGETPVMVMRTSPTDVDHVYVGTYRNGLWRSLDRGDSWHKLDLGLSNEQVFALAFDAAGVLYAGIFGWGPAVLSSSDGGLSWTDAAPGLSYAHVVQIVADPGQAGKVYIGVQ